MLQSNTVAGVVAAASAAASLRPNSCPKLHTELKLGLQTSNLGSYGFYIQEVAILGDLFCLVCVGQLVYTVVFQNSPHGLLSWAAYGRRW